MLRLYAPGIRGRGFWISTTRRRAALPGVLAVLTAEDVPNNKVGHLQQDWDVMIAKGDITRCVGDAICLVVAESRDILEKAKRMVKIDYEELEPCALSRKPWQRTRPRYTRRETCARAVMLPGGMQRRLWRIPGMW